MEFVQNGRFGGNGEDPGHVQLDYLTEGRY